MTYPTIEECIDGLNRSGLGMAVYDEILAIMKQVKSKRVEVEREQNISRNVGPHCAAIVRCDGCCKEVI